MKIPTTPIFCSKFHQFADDVIGVTRAKDIEELSASVDHDEFDLEQFMNLLFERP